MFLLQENSSALFTNDAVVLGILLIVLAIIFYTSSSPKFEKFYKYVPALLLCYFIPAFLNWPLKIISPDESRLYFVASRYLLPTSLVLLTISIDIKGILNLGPKAIIMFLTGTIGIIIGGPVALFLVSIIAPEAMAGAGPDDVWRGLSTIAGSWIGGGANQTAMKEVFNASDAIFSAMIIVDVFVANIWMAFLLFGAGISEKVDKFFKADTTSIEDLKHRIIDYQKKVMQVPTLTSLMIVMAVGFGVTALGHIVADNVAPWVRSLPNADTLQNFSLTDEFFYLIVVVTTVGLILSFTKARSLEGYGASKVGSLFLYVLVATIGMKMDIGELAANWTVYKYFILIGLLWMLVHIIILLTIAKIIKAPFFFTAVGSQANVGGAASAPIVASAFHPSLATVGVLLAVFGYAVGTYGAWLCAIIMQQVANGM